MCSSDLRVFGSNWAPIKTVADLKGHKMRAQENQVHMEMYRAFGASPTPIAVTEVLTSMQTGVVDGWDNTPLFAFAAQWTSATKNMSLTNHIYQPAAIVFNKSWFDTLSPERQAILLKARQSLMQEMRDEIRALNPILIQNLKDMKVNVYTPTAAELAKIGRAHV